MAFHVSFVISGMAQARVLDTASFAHTLLLFHILLTRTSLRLIYNNEIKDKKH